MEVNKIGFSNKEKMMEFVITKLGKLTLFDIEYLLSSFKRNNNGIYKTNMNLDYILSELDDIIHFNDDHSGLMYNVNTIFIAGSQSNYIKKDKYINEIEHFFGKNYQIKYMNANHMLFEEDYDMFMNEYFVPSLNEIDSCCI